MATLTKPDIMKLFFLNLPKIFRQVLSPTTIHKRHDSKPVNNWTESIETDSIINHYLLNHVRHVLLIIGLEDFETKVEKINKGEDSDESFGWIMEIFNKYRNSVSSIDENLENVDGLEPPNLVEKWGLKSSVNKDLSNTQG